MLTFSYSTVSVQPCLPEEGRTLYYHKQPWNGIAWWEEKTGWATVSDSVSQENLFETGWNSFPRVKYPWIAAELGHPHRGSTWYIDLTETDINIYILGNIYILRNITTWMCYFTVELLLFAGDSRFRKL